MQCPTVALRVAVAPDFMLQNVFVGKVKLSLYLTRRMGGVKTKLSVLGGY
jgi:hypothetical protein